MVKLIKADFYRLKAERSFLVGFILVLFFSPLAPLLLRLFPGENLALYALQNAITSFSSNDGLVILIVVAIIASSDFSYSTLRNKIIAGHPRWKIYLANVFLTYFVAFFYYLLRLLIVFLITLIVYGTSEVFSGDNITTLVSYLLVSMMFFSTVLAVVTCSTFLTKRLAGSIVTALAITILALILSMMPIPKPYSYLLPQLTVVTFSDINPLVPQLMIINLVYSVLFLGLGAFVFIRSEIK